MVKQVNTWIAQQTGFPGRFGAGRFQAWKAQQGGNIAATDWPSAYRRHLALLNSVAPISPVIETPMNQWIRSQTGFPQSFGAGRFQAWKAQQGGNIAATDWPSAYRNHIAVPQKNTLGTMATVATIATIANLFLS